MPSFLFSLTYRAERQTDEAYRYTLTSLDSMRWINRQVCYCRLFNVCVQKICGFLPPDATRMRGISCRLLFITLVYCIQTVKDIIKLFLDVILVF